MTTRNIVLSIDEFYHIYDRGVDKRIIFLDENDKKRFVRLLYICNGSVPVVYKSIQALPLDEIVVGEKLVAIGAYCLMTNHFHLLLKETKDGGIVKFMSKLLTSYSMYFNKKYKRAGSLFGSEFKSEHLDSDVYLKYIFSYIHLNPIGIIDSGWKNKKIKDKDKAKKFLNSYLYSSLLDYLGIKRGEQQILNQEYFPKYFESSLDFNDMVNEWINFEEENISTESL